MANMLDSILTGLSKTDLWRLSFSINMHHIIKKTLWLDKLATKLRTGEQRKLKATTETPNSRD